MSNQPEWATYDEILEVFEESQYPVLNSKRVAKEFDVEYQKMAYHLDKLVENAELESEKFGPSVVYWIPAN